MAAEQAEKGSSDTGGQKAPVNERATETQLAEGTQSSEIKENKGIESSRLAAASFEKQPSVSQVKSAETKDLMVAERGEIGHAESMIEMLQNRLAKINFLDPETDELDELISSKK